MEILKLRPATKDYLWGGTKLKEKYNKTSNEDVLAETWELSAHKDGVSIIENGEIKFTDYLKEKGNSVIGKNYDKDRFPILIKFIDALKPLSIQVHPSDEYGLKHENDYGKTEMWYILEAEEGAFLYYGFNREITKKEYSKSIEDGTIEELLNKVYVKPGDVMFIESGTVHAIGAGIVICEIQQNSNITYRVYDYKRKDKDGNERELHVEKAIEVSRLTPNPKYSFDSKNSINDKLTRLAKSDYFDVFSGELKDEEEMFNISEDSFHSIIVVDGEGILEDENGQTYKLLKGDSYFIPAQNNKYKMSGTLKYVISTLPL
ncbi:type I phosphomannose isomerase catalytic subunit [Helcococcus ovis]|uniref:type I phosphomannose isomerase catalytic subunit n=1 Tax=Helcococcus TaxID=31983 RepID=UPI0038B913FF